MKIPLMVSLSNHLSVLRQALQPGSGEPQDERNNHPFSGQLPSIWLAALIVCIASILPFLSTLPAYFLGDDFGLIWLLSQKPPLHFLTLFTSPWTETIYGYRTDELRPTLALSYQIDGVWAGAASPIAYHVSSILFHVVNSLLVLGIARRVVGLKVLASGFAGVIFALMPVHVETVSWISGRADSIPTIFYLSSFLTYAIWRQKGTGFLYMASIVLFFFALFSKQSAITMVGTLALYDILVNRKLPWASWTQPLGYVPYGVLTAGYLGLRLALFNNAVREEMLSMNKVREFWDLQSAYLQMLVSGVYFPRFDTAMQIIAVVLCGLILLVAAIELFQRKRERRPLSWTMLLCFGPAWWALSVIPLLVTNYLSSRHLYLASVGLAIVLGLAFEMLWSSRNRLWHYSGAFAGITLVLGYTLVLLWAVGQWNGVAALSAKISSDVRQEALTAPEGSLLVLDVEGPGATPRIWTWLWGFSLPYALMPPFEPPEVTKRVSIISPPYAYCCQFAQWYEHVRNTTVSWSARTDSPPVIILDWDDSTGPPTRRSDSEQPQLRKQVQTFAGAPSPEELHKMLDEVLRQVDGS